MNGVRTALGVALITVLPLATAAAQQPASPSAARSDSTAVLVGSDSLVGSAVRNPDGVDVGKVSRLMIDPTDGRIVSILVSTGATLGVGGNTIAVPWNSVKVGQDRGKLVVTASQTLEAAPGRPARPADGPANPPTR